MAARKQRPTANARRRRWVRGLLVGGAAIGLPAMANALIARRRERLAEPSWGQRRTYTWKYGQISFQRMGVGRPLVLVHSLGPGHDGEEWRAAAELLAEDHTVFVPDLLGWGNSEKPKLPYDGELYIQLLGDFMEDVVGKRSTLAAAGLSAAYAVQLAADRPRWVDSLALVTPAGIELHSEEPDLKDALANRLLRLPVAGTTLLNLLTSRTAITQHLKREGFHGPERADAATIEHHYRSSHQPGSHQSLAAYLSGYLNHPVRETLTRLRQPLWIGWGREAASPAVQAADLWLQRVPGAALEVFAGCANLPHLECAARFVQRLRPFLAADAT